MANNTIRPLREFMSLRDVMDRWLDDRFGPSLWSTWGVDGVGQLPLDVYETDDDIVVRALVPGVKPDDIDVTYENGVLTLRTKTEPHAPQGAVTWLINEIASGQAVRQVSLPRGIDVERVSTDFTDGVLTLTLPKTVDAKPKQIRVSSARQIGAGSSA